MVRLVIFSVICRVFIVKIIDREIDVHHAGVADFRASAEGRGGGRRGRAFAEIHIAADSGEAYAVACVHRRKHFVAVCDDDFLRGGDFFCDINHISVADFIAVVEVEIESVASGQLAYVDCVTACFTAFFFTAAQVDYSAAFQLRYPALTGNVPIAGAEIDVHGAVGLYAVAELRRENTGVRFSPRFVFRVFIIVRASSPVAAAEVERQRAAVRRERVAIEIHCGRRGGSSCFLYADYSALACNDVARDGTFFTSIVPVH